jgi:hypothetical protein
VLRVFCHHCDKWGYHSRSDARRQAGSRRIYTYRCRHNLQLWHLTKKKNHEEM